MHIRKHVKIRRGYSSLNVIMLHPLWLQEYGLRVKTREHNDKNAKNSSEKQ
jgi:hypothetical protein